MKIIVVGQLKDDYFRNIETDILKNINKKINFEIVELKDEKIPSNSNKKIDAQILKKEGNNILDKIKKEDFVISLCIEGKQISSSDFENSIKNNKNIVFIIGGSLGLSDEVKKRSNQKISFSNMTFTHQMMRVILIDEIDKTI